jgi:hypothetical protein
VYTGIPGKALKELETQKKFSSTRMHDGSGAKPGIIGLWNGDSLVARAAPRLRRMARAANMTGAESSQLIANTIHHDSYTNAMPYEHRQSVVTRCSVEAGGPTGPSHALSPVDSPQCFEIPTLVKTLVKTAFHTTDAPITK